MTTLIELAAALVRIPSVNPPGAERAASDLVADLLERAGLAVTHVAVSGDRESLIAVLPGAGAVPARIFTGHLDVVGVSDAERARWASDPFGGQVRDGRLWGRGSTDMKGGVAALVTAALGLRGADVTPPGDVLLVLTCDEEDLMTGSKAVVGHPLLARDADVVVCEPTGLELCTVGRGRTWARLTVRGRTGHGSRPDGRNAVQLAGDLMAALDDEDFSDVADPDFGESFWRPLAIHAGVEPCVVPDVCTLTVDARLAPDHDPDDVWRRLDRTVGVLGSRHAGLVVDVDVVDRREGWRTDPASPLVADATRALDAEGLATSLHCFSGTTDGTVLRRAGLGHGTRDVVICGPGDLGLAHRENETVSVSELETAERVCRRLMMRQ